MDTCSGSLSNPEMVAETPNPTFLAVHPDGKHLYAVNEINSFNGAGNMGSITAFKIGAEGGLQELNRQASGGSGPCHLAIDAGGRLLAVANYVGGSMSVFKIGGDGSIGLRPVIFRYRGSSVNSARQDKPHAHGVTFSRDGRRLFLCDLGTDKIMAYGIVGGKDGSVSPSNIPFASARPGAGPRHMVFNSKEDRAYVVNELDSTVSVFSCSGGALAEIQTLSMLPGDFAGKNTAAEIGLHPSGKFLYASNRGHDSIAVFQVSRKTGELSLNGNVKCGGKNPRAFGITPSGKWFLVANQDSDMVSIFRIEESSGNLLPCGSVSGISKPVCITFVVR